MHDIIPNGLSPAKKSKTDPGLGQNPWTQVVKGRLFSKKTLKSCIWDCAGQIVECFYLRENQCRGIAWQSKRTVKI